jgi:hypothetical protein
MSSRFTPRIVNPENSQMFRAPDCDGTHLDIHTRDGRLRRARILANGILVVSRGIRHCGRRPSGGWGGGNCDQKECLS